MIYLDKVLKMVKKQSVLIFCVFLFSHTISNAQSPKELLATFYAKGIESNIKYKNYGGETSYFKFNTSLDRSTSMFWIDKKSRKDSIRYFLDTTMYKSLSPLVSIANGEEHQIERIKVGSYFLSSYVTSLDEKTNVLVVEYDGSKVYILKDDIDELVELINVLK